MEVEELQGWLTITQAAEQLRVTRPTIHEWLQRGRLNGIKLPGIWLVDPDSVEAESETRQPMLGAEPN